MRDALVTVVVAAYGRPDALACALESARRQTLRDWRMLVVGDCCPSSGDVVTRLSDRRIRFVNLSSRQGEQGPPNSVGMRLATTPLIAFLNHDDLWLPEHLERAAAAIEGRGLDMYAGSAAFAHHAADVPGGRRRVVFSERTPRDRTLPDAFVLQPFALEPASSLVFTKQLADQVGPWRPAPHLYRAPLVDWLLRVWRNSATFFSDPRISVLKLNTHNKSATANTPGELRYARGAEEQALLLDMLDIVGSDGLRAVIRSDIRNATNWGVPRPRKPEKAFPNHPDAPTWTARLQDPEAAQRYLRTGEDVFDDIARDRGLSPGTMLRHALKYRTGESLGEPDDIETLVADCRRQLQTT